MIELIVSIDGYSDEEQAYIIQDFATKAAPYILGDNAKSFTHPDDIASVIRFGGGFENLLKNKEIKNTVSKSAHDAIKLLFHLTQKAEYFQMPDYFAADCLCTLFSYAIASDEFDIRGISVENSSRALMYHMLSNKPNVKITHDLLKNGAQPGFAMLYNLLTRNPSEQCIENLIYYCHSDFFEAYAIYYLISEKLMTIDDRKMSFHDMPEFAEARSQGGLLWHDPHHNIREEVRTRLLFYMQKFYDHSIEDVLNNYNNWIEFYQQSTKFNTVSKYLLERGRVHYHKIPNFDYPEIIGAIDGDIIEFSEPGIKEYGIDDSSKDKALEDRSIEKVPSSYLVKRARTISAPNNDYEAPRKESLKKASRSVINLGDETTREICMI